jgi:hypothetical protein
VVQGRRARRILTYRQHRLTLTASDGQGWAVRIWPPRARGAAAEVLRNRVPGGQAILLEEARRRIDRGLDGAAWQRMP